MVGWDVLTHVQIENPQSQNVDGRSRFGKKLSRVCTNWSGQKQLLGWMFVRPLFVVALVFALQSRLFQRVNLVYTCLLGYWI